MPKQFMLATALVGAMLVSAAAQDAASSAPELATPEEVAAFTEITTVGMMSAAEMPNRGDAAADAAGAAADAELEALRAAVEGNADIMEALEDEGFQAEDVVGVAIGDNGEVTVYHETEQR